jgi:hypothetical protein
MTSPIGTAFYSPETTEHTVVRTDCVDCFVTPKHFSHFGRRLLSISAWGRGRKLFAPEEDAKMAFKDFLASPPVMIVFLTTFS